MSYIGITDPVSWKVTRRCGSLLGSTVSTLIKLESVEVWRSPFVVLESDSTLLTVCVAFMKLSSVKFGASVTVYVMRATLLD